jgi:predicted TIM-barrel fold metal-dependent hydrolase
LIYDTHAYLGDNPLWDLYGLPVPLEADAWVEMLDQAGIDGALVAPPGVGAAEDFEPDMDRIALAVDKYPARLLGFCRVKPRQGALAIDVLRRRVTEQGFRALKLNSQDDDYRLDDRRLLDPVLDAAAELGIVVFFHTGDTHYATCTPSMVADIAIDYPDTTFIIGHMGFGGVNGFPGSTEEVIPAMQRAANTVTETAGVFKPQFIQDVIDVVGAERVLMGSNGPYAPIELPRIMIQKHMNRLSAEEKALVTGGNFERIFDLT